MAADNAQQQCARCRRASRDKFVTPPEVPAEFWQGEPLREAFAAQHIGRVIRAYRMSPYHHAVHGPTGIAQGVLGQWFGLSQSQISKIETGPPILSLDTLRHWARVLRIPQEWLWFDLSGQGTKSFRSPDDTDDDVVPAPGSDAGPTTSAHVFLGGNLAESDDRKRREYLRLFSMVGTLLVIPPTETSRDADRVDYASSHPGRLGVAKLDEYAELNSHLWRVFALSMSKGEVMPLVRQQLDVLSAGLRRPHSLATHHRLCALAGDLFQLAGEVFFDGNHYTEAAHCYTLAATASKEASAFDLWACAMTRHAFIAVYERQFDKAAPMLELAAALAQRGDSTLSTRYWVSVVQAETFAGLGDRDACERALDLAEQVRQLDGPVHNDGWLRFDGSRLAEERGTCYVSLGCPDLAEAALTDALNHTLTTRRRASVLTDLAMIGVQRSDPSRVVAYADAAVDTARQTGSGVLSRKLKALQPHLTPLLGDKQVHRLNTQITALVGHAIYR